MKTIILIAVRLKSSRLPEKALKMVEDQTLVEHLIDRMETVKNADKVILCTSTNSQDDPLVEVAKRKNVECFRGDETNVIERFIKASEKYNPDQVIRTTGDNCLVSPEFLEYAIEKHIENKADYTANIGLPQGAKGEVISFAALKKLHELVQDPHASEYMTWQLDNPSVFKVQKLPVDEKWNRPQYRVTCDTPQDLQLIREIYKRLYKPGKIVDFDAVIKLLDAHPELVDMNKEIKQVGKEDVKEKINYHLKNK